MTTDRSSDSEAYFTTIRNLGRVCRLGLATRGDTRLDRDAVLVAIERGVNYLNWCGQADGLRDAIRSLGQRRRQVNIAIQLEARTAIEARRELAGYLEELATDYLDVVTYYYVESPEEWNQIIGLGGAAEAIEEARSLGTVRAIGLTSHQRRLAAAAVRTGRLDLLMARYNAAHRGAERDVFPVTTQFDIPLVSFTCLRWGALLETTPDDPPGFEPPSARDWYRFVLNDPGVAVALMAPSSLKELETSLLLLDEPPLFPERYQELVAHGERVRRHAGSFP